MKNVILLLTLIIGFCATAQTVKNQKDFDKKYHKEIARFNKKNDSVSYQFYLRRGALSCAYARYFEALRDYDKAVEMEPANGACYYERAITKMDAAFLEAAIEDFTKAIELDPAMAGAYNNRGICYYDKEDYATAIADYNKAIELDPKTGFAYHNRGLAKLRSGLADDGCQDLHIALALGDKNSQKAISKFCTKK
ncbi:MAG: tetratricopeptide repeat protein [Bacteroidota bacterium]